MALSFLLRSVHIFLGFLKSNWGGYFGHAETGIGAKKQVVLRRKILNSNYKVECENGVSNKNSLSR